MDSQYGQMFLEAARRTQEQNEANARSRTFDVGKVIPALIASIATANPTPLLLAGTGEAARASTGSSTDIAGLAQMAGQQYMPQQTAEQSGFGALGTMPTSYQGSMPKEMGGVPMKSIEMTPEGVKSYKYERESLINEMMQNPTMIQGLLQMLQGQTPRPTAPKSVAPKGVPAFEAVDDETGRKIISDDGKNWRYAE